MNGSVVLSGCGCGSAYMPGGGVLLMFAGVRCRRWCVLIVCCRSGLDGLYMAVVTVIMGIHMGGVCMCH